MSNSEQFGSSPWQTPPRVHPSHSQSYGEPSYPPVVGLSTPYNERFRSYHSDPLYVQETNDNIFSSPSGSPVPPSLQPGSQYPQPYQSQQAISLHIPPRSGEQSVYDYRPSSVASPSTGPPSISPGPMQSSSRYSTPYPLPPSTPSRPVSSMNTLTQSYTYGQPPSYANSHTSSPSVPNRPQSTQSFSSSASMWSAGSSSAASSSSAPPRPPKNFDNSPYGYFAGNFSPRQSVQHPSVSFGQSSISPPPLPPKFPPPPPMGSSDSIFNAYPSPSSSTALHSETPFGSNSLYPTIASPSTMELPGSSLSPSYFAGMSDPGVLDAKYQHSEEAPESQPDYRAQNDENDEELAQAMLESQKLFDEAATRNGQLLSQHLGRKPKVRATGLEPIPAEDEGWNDEFVYRNEDDDIEAGLSDEEDEDLARALRESLRDVEPRRSASPTRPPSPSLPAPTTSTPGAGSLLSVGNGVGGPGFPLMPLTASPRPIQSELESWDDDRSALESRTSSSSALPVQMPSSSLLVHAGAPPSSHPSPSSQTLAIVPPLASPIMPPADATAITTSPLLTQLPNYEDLHRAWDAPPVVAPPAVVVQRPSADTTPRTSELSSSASTLLTAAVDASLAPQSTDGPTLRSSASHNNLSHAPSSFDSPHPSRSGRIRADSATATGRPMSTPGMQASAGVMGSPAARPPTGGISRKTKSAFAVPTRGGPSGGPLTPSPPRATAVEGDVMDGVSYGFGEPIIKRHGTRPDIPFPDVVTLGFNEVFHIVAPSFRQLLRLLASLSMSNLEPTPSAAVALKIPTLALRPTLQFLKARTSVDHVTILWLEIDVPVPPSFPGASKYTNGDTAQRPFNTALPETAAHDPRKGSQLFSCQAPLPPLPRAFPDLSNYLQTLFMESRKTKDSSSGIKRLSKLIDTIYGANAKDSDAGEVGGETGIVGGTRGVSGLFSRVIARRDKRKEGNGANEETYDLVTPFRLDEWGT